VCQPIGECPPTRCKWWRELPCRAFSLTAHVDDAFGSSYSIRIPNFTFVGLPVPKIWLTFGHSVKRPGDLDLGTGVGCQPSHTTTVLSIFFCGSTTSRSQVTDKRASAWRHDLITLTFDLWRHRACRWCGSSYPIPIPSLKFIRLPLERCGIFSISSLIGLVTLTFDGRRDDGHQCFMAHPSAAGA